MDNRTRLQSLEYLLDAGRRGLHLIFPKDRIRSVFLGDLDRVKRTIEGKGAELNDALNDLLLFPNSEEKKRFFDVLPDEIQSAIIFGYFQILDGEMQKNGFVLQ